MSEKYNGAANWATWFVSSTFSNIETPYIKMRDLAGEDVSGGKLREYAEALLFGTPDSDLHPSELDQIHYARKHISQAEFDEVDWEEVQGDFSEE